MERGRVQVDLRTISLNFLHRAEILDCNVKDGRHVKAREKMCYIHKKEINVLLVNYHIKMKNADEFNVLMFNNCDDFINFINYFIINHRSYFKKWILLNL